MTDDERRQDAEASPLRRIDRKTNGEIGPTERLAMNRTGSFDWDLDTRTLDIDEAGLMVFGVDPATFDARPGALLEHLEPAERARLDVTIDEAITGGSNSYSVHFRVPLDDGTTVDPRPGSHSALEGRHGPPDRGGRPGRDGGGHPFGLRSRSGKAAAAPDQYR